MSATLLSGLVPNFAVFLLFRLLVGIAIGGEGAAKNSAVDELIPARVRGRIDLLINGSAWLSVEAGALLTTLLLNVTYLTHSISWRLAFGLGAVFSVASEGKSLEELAENEEEPLLPETSSSERTRSLPD